MDSISINFGAFCRYDSSGKVISVMISVEEYNYLCEKVGKDIEVLESTNNFKILDYDKFHDLVARAMVEEWNDE